MRGALIFLSLLLISCGKRNVDSDNLMIVSIPPLKYIVESIVGDDFEIKVLLPSGASPETFEPTPLQMVGVQNSEMIFGTGLIAFERNVLTKATSEVPENKYVDLSRGVELIGAHDSDTHHHGTDPHIWISPKALRIMARNALDAISGRYPDSVRYVSNFKMLDSDLEALDSVVAKRVDASGIKEFVVFHPSFSYYARDYSLEQIALEHDGKEPSAEQMRRLVDRLRGRGIKNVLYQREFPRSMADILAAEIGATAVETDILNEDVKACILRATDLITER